MALRSRVALVPAFALAGVFGCTRVPRAPQLLTSNGRPAGKPCNGQAYVDVLNQLESSVEIYAVPLDRSAPWHLASVPPGSQRIPLTQPVAYVYTERDGQRGGGGRDRGRGRPGTVSMTLRCEKAAEAHPTRAD